MMNLNEIPQEIKKFSLIAILVFCALCVVSVLRGKKLMNTFLGARRARAKMISPFRGADLGQRNN